MKIDDEPIVPKWSASRARGDLPLGSSEPLIIACPAILPKMQKPIKRQRSSISRNIIAASAGRRLQAERTLAPIVEEVSEEMPAEPTAPGEVVEEKEDQEENDDGNISGEDEPP